LFTKLTPFRFLLGNPIPFIPFPLSRGRGISYIREAKPPFGPPSKGEGEEILEGAKPLSYPSLQRKIPLSGVSKRG